MYYLYILRSIGFEKTYVGITDNLKRRLEEHNSGLSFYTKRYLPWEIIYIEEHENRFGARKRDLL